MQARHVPVEFIGKARALRRRVDEAEAAIAAAMPPVITPIQRRLKKNPRLREEQMWDFCWAWQRLPSSFRLAVDADVPKKGQLVLVEHLLAAAKHRDPRWLEPDWEPGIALLRVCLTTEGGLKMETRPRVLISLHALARWYQRAEADDDAALVADCRPLLRTSADDRVGAASGVWCGSITLVRGDNEQNLRVRMVRTFLAEEMLPNRAAPNPHSSSSIPVEPLR